MLEYCSIRLHGVCARAEIKTVHELKRYTKSEFLEQFGCGRKTTVEAEKLLASYDLAFTKEAPEPPEPPRKVAHYDFKKLSNRNRSIVIEVVEGATLKFVSERYNLSVERVRQIVTTTVWRIAVATNTMDTHQSGIIHSRDNAPIIIRFLNAI